MKYCISLLWGFVLLSGCVSSKQLSHLESSNQLLEQENLKLKSNREEYLVLREEYAHLKKRNVNTEKGIRDLISRYDSLNLKFFELKSGAEPNQNNSNQSNPTTSLSLINENQKLKDEIQNKLQTIWDLEMKLDQGIGTAENSSAGKLITALKKDTNTIFITDEALSSLQKELKQLLDGYNDTTIQLFNRDGHLYLVFSEHVLFHSNTKSISKQGGKTLFEFSQIIKKFKKPFVTIIGHTDSIGTPKNNWELSTGRAAEVVNTLINSGINPNKLTAGGRSQFDPLVKNDSNLEKSINNRIEIVISSRKLL